MSQVTINVPMQKYPRNVIELKLFRNNTTPSRLSDVFNRLDLNYARFNATLANKGIVRGDFNPCVNTPKIESDYSMKSNNIVVTFFGTELGDDREILVNGELYMADSDYVFEDIYGKQPGFYPIMKENGNMRVIPKIADIELFNENGGLPTVKVTFTDGSHTTATCSEADISHFSFEQGIGICLGKKMLGPAYNRLIDKGCKMYFKKVEAQQKAVEDRRKQADILARKKAKRDARIARRKEKQRQEKVDILVEAIRQAKESPVRFEGSDIATNFSKFGEIAEYINRFAKTNLNLDRDDKVIYLRSLGKTYKEIAEELGISKTTVARIIRESNKE